MVHTAKEFLDAAGLHDVTARPTTTAPLDMQTLVNENEALKDRVYNLTLYLKFVDDKILSTALWDMLEDHFDGMPGYCPQSVGLPDIK